MHKVSNGRPWPAIKFLILFRRMPNMITRLNSLTLEPSTFIFHSRLGELDSAGATPISKALSHDHMSTGY